MSAINQFKIVVAGKFKVKSEKREQFIKLALDTLKLSSSDQGCIDYNFYEDASEQGKFLFFEEWADQDALDGHFQTKHFHEFMQEFPDLIIEKPIIKLYSVEGVKEL